MIAWLAGLLASMAAPAPAPAPASAAPRWVVDWGQNRCSLVRETGGADSLSLMVRTVPGAGLAELWLLNPRWKGPVLTALKPVDVSLAPTGFRAAQYPLAILFNGQRGLAVTNLDPGLLRNLAGAHALRIEQGGRSLVEVPLPGSAKAASALRACEAAVLRDWGFDAEVIQSLSRVPEPIDGPAQWFSDRDYPFEAVRKRISGSVLTRLVISSEGRVAECIVIEGSGEILLDRTTCDLLMKRGRYRPALTAAGQPVRAMSSVRIVWRLPRG